MHGAWCMLGADIMNHLPSIFSTILLKVSPVMTTYPVIAEEDRGKEQTHHQRVANAVCTTNYAPKKGKKN